LFLARFRKYLFPFKRPGTVVLDFIPTRLSCPEPVYLARGDLDNLAALDTDIEQLAIGELLKFVERGEAAKPLAKTGEGAADQIGAMGFMGLAEGDFSEVGHDCNLSVIFEGEWMIER
jgi:hypothetical protein